MFLHASILWLKHVCLYLFVVIQPASFTDNVCDVSFFSGNNYRIWKERVFLQLWCMDIDYTIRKDEPFVPIETNT